MKKIIAVLMALCLLCSAAALAETPKFEDMPAMILLDSFFEGTWVAKTAFAGETYVDLDMLPAVYNISIPTVTITEAEHLVIIEGTNENGEAVREEYPYTLENSQLECEDDEGQILLFELLEDHNICLSVFVPGEGEETMCISIFMVRADAKQ